MHLLFLHTSAIVRLVDSTTDFCRLDSFRLGSSGQKRRSLCASSARLRLQCYVTTANDNLILTTPSLASPHPTPPHTMHLTDHQRELGSGWTLSVLPVYSRIRLASFVIVTHFPLTRCPASSARTFASVRTVPPPQFLHLATPSFDQSYCRLPQLLPSPPLFS